MEIKIAIVVQRYGLEVNGGAEFHARVLAEKLAQKYSVEILTTTALNYHGWKNYFKVGLDTINLINVRRFKTIKTNARSIRKARRDILKRKKYFKTLHFFGLFNFFEKKI